MTTALSTELALITGASSGIGVELARLHVAAGGRVVLTARRAPALARLARELGPACVHVEPCDLALPGAAARLAADLAARGLTIDILVNNAGMGGAGPFPTRDEASLHAMMQLNMIAPTELLRAFLPGMLARRRGRILNVASLAGFVPGPGHAVYYATKAYLLSLSEALAAELAGTGVHVTALCPGPTESEFFARAGVAPQPGMSTARDVACAGYDALRRGCAVRIPTAAERLQVAIVTSLPRALVRQRQEEQGSDLEPPRDALAR